MFKLPRLLIMMFLQYFVQGAWNMVIGAVLAAYGLKEIVGSTYSVLGIATIISPLFIGMIADRFIASQKVMGTLHILNGAVLFTLPFFVVDGNVSGFLIMIFVVGLLFYPTTALANSVSFRHIDGVKWFPIVRVFGTIGFMTVGFTLGFTGFSGTVSSFKLAAIASVIYGLYCFTLPNTPPASKGKKFSMRDVLCLDALSLFKDKYFTIFMLSTFVLMISKTAYSAYLPVYLPVLGLEPASMMQIATAVEVLFMVFLAFLLGRFGFKKIILFGAICWIIRSLFLSQAAVSDNYLTYVIIALLLQGACWDFFFTAGDIYVDRKAGIEIKAQAQGLRFIVSNGFGVFMASTVCGIINNNVVTEKALPAAAPQWQEFWIYPAVVAAVVSVGFWIFFKDKDVIIPRKTDNAAA
ncbi:MFS transporter [Zophobihabitans entericus]|uniref:Nucleoside permease n=1 Tax=Zophobihabitans entericus TaxID=1635327 RepID=A0A6G9IBF5_9GAMM|nr:MFS transporter [Zophobihabitans entericus]QIQ21044.1 nucleoside permease [Zophobihabitans entericus]